MKYDIHNRATRYVRGDSVILETVSACNQSEKDGANNVTVVKIGEKIISIKTDKKKRNSVGSTPCGGWDGDNGHERKHCANPPLNMS